MEVELAGDQEDHGVDGVEAREAASAALGGLVQAATSIASSSIAACAGRAATAGPSAAYP